MGYRHTKAVPLGLPFFGIHVLGPIETNLGGAGKSTLWPPWLPTSYRALDNFGGVPPGYTYAQSVTAWDAVETAANTFDWSLFDLIWAKLIAEGVTDVSFGFQNIPSWAVSPASPMPPTNLSPSGFDLTAVSHWVKSYLARATLKGLSIKFVEGINEPNTLSWGAATGTNADLAAIQQAIYQGAKSVDPSIQVLSPPYNSLQAATLQFGGFLSAGGGAWCDIISFHGYTDVSISKASDYQTYLNSFKSLLASNGQGGKPLWNLEYNSLTGVSATDAKWLATVMLLDWSNGVLRNFYYSMDSGTPKSVLWDYTVGPSGTMTQAGVAYQQMINWLQGAILSQGATLVSNVWTCYIAKANYQAVIAWTDDGTSTSYTTPSWASHYRDLTGASTAITPTVTLTDFPIIMET